MQMRCVAAEMPHPSMAVGADVRLHLEEMVWIRSWAAEQGIQMEYITTLLLSLSRFTLATLDGSSLCRCSSVVAPSFMPVHVFRVKCSFS